MASEVKSDFRFLLLLAYEFFLFFNKRNVIRNYKFSKKLNKFIGIYCRFGPSNHSTSLSMKTCSPSNAVVFKSKNRESLRTRALHKKARNTRRRRRLRARVISRLVEKCINGGEGGGEHGTSRGRRRFALFPLRTPYSGNLIGPRTFVSCALP